MRLPALMVTLPVYGLPRIHTRSFQMPPTSRTGATRSGSYVLYAQDGGRRGGLRKVGRAQWLGPGRVVCRKKCCHLLSGEGT